MKINMSGIGQITSAITQLGSVIQQNAGSSEELASMAEELFAQSQSLRETIGFFKLDETALLPKQTEETDQLELPP
jgi:methyl-accepting chemotaxis protein